MDGEGDEGWIKVRWDQSGNKASYRAGRNGSYDLAFASGGDGGGGGRSTTPSGRPLTEFVVPNSSFTCDDCRRRLTDGETAFGNREEDWDLCRSCFEGAQPSRPVAQAAAGTPKIGNRVRIRPVPEAEARRLQEAHGGFADSMAEMLGREGAVTGIDSDGDIRVHGKCWNPALVELVADGGARAGGSGSATPESIVVHGAGHRRTNGTYRLVVGQQHNGHPYWQKVGGDGRIYFRTGTGWVTNEDSNFSYWDYISGEHPLPPAGTWPPRSGSSSSGETEPSTRATNPRPTFTLGATTTGATTSSFTVGARVRVRRDMDEPTTGWGSIDHSSVGVGGGSGGDGCQ